MITTNPTECPYYLVSRVTLAITMSMKKALASANVKNIRPAYLGVLMSLWKEDGLKVVDLGKKAGLEPSTMTGLLDRMERDELLKRAADPKDRRALRIYLTEKALDSQESAMKVVNKVLDKMFENISDEDIETTTSVLMKVLENSPKEIIN